MEDEPPSPKSEFVMAIAEPVSSVLLAALLYAAMWGGRSIGWPEPANGMLGYLAFINILLAMFNLVPAFPLDGGRVFRSALWAWTGDLRWGCRRNGQSRLTVLHVPLRMKTPMKDCDE